MITTGSEGGGGMGIDSAPGPGVFLTELPELKPDAKELVASAAPAVPLPRSDKDDSSAKKLLLHHFWF